LLAGHNGLYNKTYNNKPTYLTRLSPAVSTIMRMKVPLEALFNRRARARAPGILFQEIGVEEKKIVRISFSAVGILIGLIGAQYSFNPGGTSHNLIAGIVFSIIIGVSIVIMVAVGEQ
jgi:hypothetical protein